MVRETSQWEREEMEKVVSERKEPLPCQIRRKDGSTSVKVVFHISLSKSN